MRDSRKSLLAGVFVSVLVLMVGVAMWYGNGSGASWGSNPLTVYQCDAAGICTGRPTWEIWLGFSYALLGFYWLGVGASALRGWIKSGADTMLPPAQKGAPQKKPAV